MSSAEERGSVAEAPPEHEQQNGDGFDPVEAEQHEHPGSFDPGLETGYLRRGQRDHELPVEIGAAPFDPGPDRYDTRRARRAARRREKAEQKRRERAERQERERLEREAAEKERREREARERVEGERREREERARAVAERSKREAELRHQREERQRGERERAERVQAERERLRRDEKEREERERKLKVREQAERKREAQIERQVALKDERDRRARERAERERREQEARVEKERKARVRAKRDREKRERKDRRRGERQRPEQAAPKRRPAAKGAPTRGRPAAKGAVARPKRRPADAAVSLKPAAQPRTRAKPARIAGVQPGRTSLKRPTAKAALALGAVTAFAIGAGALLGLPVPVLSSSSDEPATVAGDAALAALATGTPVELTEGPYFPVVLDAPANFGETAAKFHADRGGRKHEGQDVFAKPGTPLVAVRDGVVLDGAGGTNFYETGGGNSLVLYSPVDNRSYVYLHMLKPPLVKAGDQIRAGQPVGQVGCTGSCDGPHLHFEVRIARADFGAETKAIDPLPLMRQWPQRPTS
jgi:murein DD-endopeptidase MepM/ murein hydrolase activator NlpD